MEPFIWKYILKCRQNGIFYDKSWEDLAADCRNDVRVGKNRIEEIKQSMDIKDEMQREPKL